jgi:hypothetical protein
VFQNEAADTAYVMGGVALESKAKPKEAAASKGAKKSSKSAGQSVQVPVTYSDLWAINLNNSSWSQVKKRGYFPATGRFAMGVAVQKEKQVRDDERNSGGRILQRSDWCLPHTVGSHPASLSRACVLRTSARVVVIAALLPVWRREGR